MTSYNFYKISACVCFEVCMTAYIFEASTKQERSPLRPDRNMISLSSIASKITCNIFTSTKPSVIYLWWFYDEYLRVISLRLIRNASNASEIESIRSSASIISSLRNLSDSSSMTVGCSIVSLFGVWILF